MRRTVAVISLLAGCGFTLTPGNAPPLDAPIDAPPLAEFGDGKDGPLDVTSTLVINRCHELVSVMGSDQLVVATWGDEPVGRRLLLLQVQDVFATSGDPASIDLAHQPADAGRWQEVVVASVDRTANQPVLTVRPTITVAFGTLPDRTRVAQACTVPEYTDVDVSAGGSLVATRWNGATGGVVALYAQGSVRLDGQIDTVGAGFRGGQRKPVNMDNDVTDLDTTNGRGGGKGESLDGRSWSREGRGNYSNGAGGGGGSHSGGGGGGGAGAGGLGGYQWNSSGNNVGPDTRGLGGSAFAFAPTVRLAFGGGGGAGHTRWTSTSPYCADGFGGDGGAGGGLVLVTAATIGGLGKIVAEGLPGTCTWPNGASGGGGGGTIRVHATTIASLGGISASGGAGGFNYDINGRAGPGGGGGGGHVVTRGAIGSALTISVAGGASGLHSDPDLTPFVNDDPWGATAGAIGVQTALP